MISIVIKALNEEAKIGRCIESPIAALREVQNPSEIILADSVSADRTIESGTALSDFDRAISVCR